MKFNKPTPQFELITRNQKGRRRYEVWATYKEFMEVQLLLDRMREQENDTK